MTDPASDNQEGTRVDEATRRLGGVIKTARTGRYTVQELAAAAGVSAGLISQIERGMGNPSYRTLHRLATALDLRMGELLEAAAPRDATTRVVRKQQRTRIQFGEDGLVHELLTPNLRGRIEMLQTEVPPGFSNEGHPFRHDGEECVLVLSGSLVVDLDGEQIQLEAGDAVTYDSATPHWWENRSDGPATVIGAVTPPTF